MPRLLLSALLGACLCVTAVRAEESPAKPAAERNAASPVNNPPAAESRPAVPKKPAAAPTPPRTVGKLAWHTDYTLAFREARQEARQLLLFFRDNQQADLCNAYEQQVLAHPDLHDALSQVSRVILDVSTPNPVLENDDETPRPLLKHSAFEHQYGKPGLVIIDLEDEDSEVYGQVVSCHPFGPHRPYTVASTKVILELPSGTVTQRALTFAMRMHPSAPRSAFGKAHPYLMLQSYKSSQLMAQYAAVGHHDWGTRSSDISAKAGVSPMEVAASSFGSPQLIEAAFELVQTWQGSPTHWGMITTPSAVFGYDMVRAPGGIWYGTGIFGN